MLARQARVNYQSLNDEGLVALVAAGDRQALGTLYDRYSRLVFSLVVRVLGEGMAAEEVTQDTFMSVWRGAAGFQPERGKFSSWVLAISRNRAVDELRRRRGRVEGDAMQLEESASWEPVAAQQFEDDSERRIVVLRALADLPPAQRRAIELAYFGGMTHQEIATTLNEPAGTIKTRIRLGMIRLKTLMAEYRSSSEPARGSRQE